MTKDNGYRAQISAGKGLTHVLTPDGGAIPIEKIMEAIAFRAHVRRLFTLDDDTNFKSPFPSMRGAIPDGDLEAVPTAALIESAEEWANGWRDGIAHAVDVIDLARQGQVAELKDEPLKILAQDIVNLYKRQSLGEFGHHSDPEQDWLIEVEVLDGEFLHLRMEFSNDNPNINYLRTLFWKALHCKYAIHCGNLLRQRSPLPADIAGKVERFQKYSSMLAERHVALTKLMHELGEMQFNSMREDAEKLDMIVGNTQGILYSQRSLLSRVADRLRRIYEAS